MPRNGSAGTAPTGGRVPRREQRGPAARGRNGTGSRKPVQLGLRPQSATRAATTRARSWPCASTRARAQAARRRTWQRRRGRRALRTCGTRPERTLVTRPGPARLAAAGGEVANDGGATEQGPLRRGLPRTPRRATCGTRPERNRVARTGPARLAAATGGTTNDDWHLEQPLASHQGEGAHGSADAAAASWEAADRGTRSERILVVRLGPARHAATGDDATNGDQHTVTAPPTQKGAGARCAAEDMAATADEGRGGDPEVRPGR